jgi:predicted NBD/HSP70 family sugar kinase
LWGATTITLPRSPIPIGANLETVRRDNLSTLLRHVHLRPTVSRSDLVALTGLNRSTVGALVGDLADHGLVRETRGSRLGQPGRPSPVVRPVADRAVVLALETAVDSLAVGVVGLGGVVHELVRVDRPRGHTSPESTVADLAALVERTGAVRGYADRIVGIGVSSMAIVRRDDGFILLAPNLGWTNVDLRSQLEAALGLGLPITIGNEADLGAVAEHVRGAGRGSDDLIYLSAEVGVGSGVIIAGQPLAGAAGYGGEVGHIAVNPDGRLCACGSRGCWETEIGELALLRYAGRSGGGGREAVDAVFADAEAGSPSALRAFAEVGRWIGLGLASLVNIFNPRLVVLGTHLARMHPYTREAMHRELDARALSMARELVTVVPSELGVDAPLLGAAESAFAPVLRDPIGWANRDLPRRTGKRTA